MITGGVKNCMSCFLLPGNTELFSAALNHVENVSSDMRVGGLVVVDNGVMILYDRTGFTILQSEGTSVYVPNTLI